MGSGAIEPPAAKGPPRGGHQPVTIITETVEKPSLDDRSYRVIKLFNQLEALLVHDPNTDKASASLDVNVGNFSDETDIPGLAHAVEHLLFMGTRKYPEENDYNQYLSSNSGGSNAYTSTTSTNYYFDVSSKPHDGGEASAANPSPLYSGLDRFAQFFIEPLFLASAVDRELRAVDSENKKNLQNDQWRLHQLEKSLSNPKHPFCNFSTGNLDVLKIQPEARGINVRDKFIAFHDKYYSANQMKLVVLGREPLDVLQDWVADLFSAVPNKNLPQNRWTDAEPYSAEYLGLQIFAKPVMDSRELTIRFPFPDESLLHESQPSRYIGHLLGHEGPGSVMSLIKSKGWANSLGAGMYPVCPGSPSLFDVTIRLTEEGLKNYKEVVKVVFQYISLLRETPAQQWIFDEMKGLSDVDFKFMQKAPASRFTSKMSSLMQRQIPRERLLRGLSCLYKFEPELIQKAIGYLRPDNFRLTLTSRAFPGDWDQKEKWYGTEYKVEKIPIDFMGDIRTAFSMSKEDRVAKLHMPHHNQFVPTKLEVEKKEVKTPAPSPRVIRNDNVARTWFKKDDTFWVPKGTLTVNLQSPIIFAGAANFTKTDVFTDLVRDALEEYSYDADLAGLTYNVVLESRALVVEVSGYNDKLPVLLEQVLVTMRDLEVKDDRFEIVKERCSRSLRNYGFQQPYYIVPDFVAWLSSGSTFTIEEMAYELPAITAESMRRFVKDLLSQLHLEIHVHGNIYKEDALKLTDVIESTLHPRPLPKAQWPIWRDVALPPGSNYVFEKKLEDKENVNHAIEYLLHIGSRSDRRIRALTLLLDQLTHEPAYDQLRTKQQLGYVVFSGARSGITSLGFRFLVQSEKVPAFLEGRVDAFLTDFADTLKNMTESAFEGHKRSLVAKRLEKPKNLNQETARHWIQICNEYYDFEFARKDAEEIKKLKKEDMVAFYAHYIDPKSTERAKLSVHLVAQAESDVTKKQISELVKTLDLDEAMTGKTETDLQARLGTTSQGDEADEIEDLRKYFAQSLKLADDKVDRAVEAWKPLCNYHKVAIDKGGPKPAPNGTTPVHVDNIRDFRASLALMARATTTDISEFLDVDAKL